MSTHPEEGMYLTHETHGMNRGSKSSVAAVLHAQQRSEIAASASDRADKEGGHHHKTAAVAHRHASNAWKKAGGIHQADLHQKHAKHHDSGWARWRAKHGKW
jgi:hypothetical protein